MTCIIIHKKDSNRIRNCYIKEIDPDKKKAGYYNNNNNKSW